MQIFLAFAAILGFAIHHPPVVLIAAPAMGLRRALVLGTVLSSLSCPLLALVDGVGIALALFIAVSASAKCSTVPATTSSFPRLATPSAGGDRSDWSKRSAPWRRSPAPELGGLLLTTVGPWAAFGTAFLVGLAAILPLLQIDEPQVPRTMPVGAYGAATNAVRLTSPTAGSR